MWLSRLHGPDRHALYRGSMGWGAALGVFLGFASLPSPLAFLLLGAIFLLTTDLLAAAAGWALGALAAELGMEWSHELGTRLLEWSTLQTLWAAALESRFFILSRLNNSVGLGSTLIGFGAGGALLAAAAWARTPLRLHLRAWGAAGWVIVVVTILVPWRSSLDARVHQASTRLISEIAGTPMTLRHSTLSLWNRTLTWEGVEAPGVLRIDRVEFKFLLSELARGRFHVETGTMTGFTPLFKWSYSGNQEGSPSLRLYERLAAGEAIDWPEPKTPPPTPALDRLEKELGTWAKEIETLRQQFEASKARGEAKHLRLSLLSQLTPWMSRNWESEIEAAVNADSALIRKHLGLPATAADELAQELHGPEALLFESVVTWTFELRTRVLSLQSSQKRPWLSHEGLDYWVSGRLNAPAQFDFRSMNLRSTSSDRTPRAIAIQGGLGGLSSSTDTVRTVLQASGIQNLSVKPSHSVEEVPLQWLDVHLDVRLDQEKTLKVSITARSYPKSLWISDSLQSELLFLAKEAPNTGKIWMAHWTINGARPVTRTLYPQVAKSINDAERRMLKGVRLRVEKNQTGVLRFESEAAEALERALQSRFGHYVETIRRKIERKRKSQRGKVTYLSSMAEKARLASQDLMTIREK